MFDLHSPFTFIALLQNILSLCGDIKFDLLLLGGDSSDCYSISRFPTTQNRAEDFHYEVTCTAEILKKLSDANKKATKIFIQGNHEERLQKLMDRFLKAFRNLPELQIEKLLKLEKYGYNYYEHFYKLNHDFIITHGRRVCKQSAKFELEDWGMSGASGHVHRFNEHKNNYNEQLGLKHKQWFSFGCLADVNQLDYARDFRSKWDNSFGIIKYNDDDFDMTVIHPSKITGGFYCPINGSFYGKKN